MTTSAPCKPCSGFNYCFWSKLMVAIVLFPLVAAYAASFFYYEWQQTLAAALAIGVTVWLAVVIDQSPLLQSMVVKRNACRK